MGRIMIAGTSSGCGKTSVVCGILQALVNRGIRTDAYKCGPDYIDPMFHSRITGISVHNLDRWFCGKDTLRYLLSRSESDISVIEGVMGFYDGSGEEASSCAVSVDCEIPAVIVIDCKGMSMSVGAVMKGFLEYRPNRIAGFIFNRLAPSLEEQTRKLCKELGTEYLGRFPYCPECVIESRHLGLVTASEIDGLKEKMQKLSENAEKYIDIDRLCTIAASAGTPDFVPPRIKENVACGARIAVSRDEAFCFEYAENWELLTEMGCELISFSPLNDKKLPEKINGLWLCGGYPELYAQRLSENREMLKAVRDAVLGGMPTIAECGGFMYLCRSIKTKDGREYEMAGVFDGCCYPTEKLSRFGYTELTAVKDNLLCNKGEIIRSHEFHYWDCTDFGEDFIGRKRKGKETPCVHADENIYAGFPHLYLYSHISAAERFAVRCMEFGKQR